MSVDIYSASGEETFFSNAGWAFLLTFAMEYGWQPAGTLAPAGYEVWDGNYDAPEGQTITASDAEAIAQAICAGIDAGDRLEKSYAIAATLTQKVGGSIQAFTFSPDSVAHWRNFVEIARKGLFIIW